MNDVKLKVVEIPKEKGCVKANIELISKVLGSGIATCKLWTPGKKGATIQISRIKGQSFKSVKTLADSILTIIEDPINYPEIKKKHNKDTSDESSEIAVKCTFCEKICKNKIGYNIHIGKVHAEMTKGALNIEINVKGVGLLSKFKSACEWCDSMFFGDSQADSIVKVNSHKMQCSLRETLHDEGKQYKCEHCGKITFTEAEMKRHERDNHDVLSRSTSPKPKRRKDIIQSIADDDPDDENAIFTKEERTCFEETRFEDSIMITNQEYTTEVDVMNVEEEAEEMVKHMSKMQDDKILKKRKKMEEDEKNEYNTQENKKHDETITERKKESKISYESINDEVPPWCSKISDKYGPMFEQRGLNIKEYFILPTIGNGACGAYCTALS